MMPEMKTKVRQLLVNHEGYRKFPYVDTAGKITVGVGYNLTDRGLPEHFINSQLNEDIDYHFKELLDAYPWFAELNEARQIAIINMRYNLGAKRFETFKKMLIALNNHDYERAAFEMLNSKWADQVHGRAVELADIIKTGELT